MAVCQNLVPLVNIKIAGKWMFIPLKMVLIGIDPYPYQEISTAKKTEGTPQGGRCRVGHRGFPKLLGVHHQGVRLSQGPGDFSTRMGPRR